MVTKMKQASITQDIQYQDSVEVSGQNNHALKALLAIKLRRHQLHAPDSGPSGLNV